MKLHISNLLRIIALDLKDRQKWIKTVLTRDKNFGEVTKLLHEDYKESGQDLKAYLSKVKQNVKDIVTKDKTIQNLRDEGTLDIVEEEKPEKTPKAKPIKKKASLAEALDLIKDMWSKNAKLVLEAFGIKGPVPMEKELPVEDIAEVFANVIVENASSSITKKNVEKIEEGKKKKKEKQKSKQVKQINLEFSNILRKDSKMKEGVNSLVDTWKSSPEERIDQSKPESIRDAGNTFLKTVAYDLGKVMTKRSYEVPKSKSDVEGLSSDIKKYTPAYAAGINRLRDVWKSHIPKLQNMYRGVDVTNANDVFLRAVMFDLERQMNSGADWKAALTGPLMSAFDKITDKILEFFKSRSAADKLRGVAYQLTKDQ